MKISSLPGKAIEVEGELSEPRVKKIISNLSGNYQRPDAW
jgi:hypothetical protein